VKPLQFVLLLSLLLPVGCSAQTSQPKSQPQAELNRRIENTVRNITDAPPTVQVNVGERSPSQYEGWDKLPITFVGARGRQTLEFLISKDNSKLARFNTFNLAADPMTKIDITGRPIRGNKDAKVTIVNFDDFQCPYCARMHEVLTDDILKTYGNEIRVIYKDYPLLSIHPWAKRAAMTANCLSAQSGEAFWDFADYVHGNARDIGKDGTPTLALTKVAVDVAGKDKLDAKKLDACLKSDDDTQVRASMAEAESLGVSATPTMFVNGEKVEGAVDPATLRAVIDRALVDAGEPVPKEAPAATEAPGNPGK